MLQEREIRRQVRVGAGVRLDIGVPGAKQDLRSVDGQLFDHVDKLATPVISLARKALGILVGEYRTDSREDGFADIVLGSDQLDAFALSLLLPPDRGRNFWIERSKRFGGGHGRFSLERIRR